MNAVDSALTALYHLSKSALFRLDPESVHDRAIRALRLLSREPLLLDALTRSIPDHDGRLQVKALGQELPLPIGIAAGFDKNAVAFPALLALGFGTIETGTVTPEPQAGNPKPRVYRLVEDNGLINRLGFPNHGVEAVVNNLISLRQPSRLVGCNIGPNKRAVEEGRAPEDFARSWRRVAPYCSYVAVNISSPNTPGLRSHQRADALEAILQALRPERTTRQRRPMVLKISPDLAEEELADVVAVAVSHRVDAIVATNTTLDRPATLRSRHAMENGGLSGAPLAPRSASTVQRVIAMAGGKLDVIAAGGIFTGLDVLAAISAGAAFAQTYTGLVYRGPAMPALVQAEMLELMNKHGIRDLTELRGSNVRL